MTLPIPGRGYYLVPQCAENLCLGAVLVPNGYNPLLQPRNEPANQVWNAFAYNGDAGTSGLGFAFSCVRAAPGDRGLAIDYMLGYVDPDAPVSLTYLKAQYEQGSERGSMDALSQADAQKLCWNLIPHGDYFAIQNAYNTDQNLNVAGGGNAVGTGVVVWDWSGGASNELWKFLPY